MNFKKSYSRFAGMFFARNQEFLRDRSSLAWNFLFPFFLLVGFSFMFSRDKPPESIKVGITGARAQAWQQQIEDLPQVQVVVMPNPEEARDKLAHHKLDLLLNTDTQPPVYLVSETAPKGYQAELMVIRLLEARQRPPPKLFTRQSLHGTEVPYLDWFFPGMLGMNIMFSAVFGVCYVIVRYRKNGVLKRLSATPLTAFEYLSAQLASRMFLIVFTTVILFGGSMLLFHFEVRGSWPALLLIFLLGSASMVAMGMLVAARTESEELAGGLLNLLTWPMMFLSEVWFSLEGSPQWLQQVALIFPLTHLITGARRIMNDGAGLADVSVHLAVLTVMTIGFLLLGATLFRWTKR
ncbi:MAG: ABC transporter permease [Candidatus Sericytochromatia bacterium]